MKKQKFYDISDAGKNWFLKSAAQKWKDFKSTLKEEYFDENLTDEELNKRHGDRVNDEDWKVLVNYWKSPESEVRPIYTYVTCIVQYLCIV
jgi:DNA-binding PadR family transcriptional regulator